MTDENQLNVPVTNFIIRDVGNIPLVDAHMHIQSNDIAPIPIMKGVAYYKGAKLAADIYRKLHKVINYHELSFRENEEFPEKDDISPAVFTGQGFLGNIFALVAGDTRESITDKTALIVKDYGKITRHTSFNIAGIYMNTLLKNAMGFGSRRKIKVINSLNPSEYDEDKDSKTKSEKERDKLIGNQYEKPLPVFKKLVSGYYEGEMQKINGVFEFSIVLGMELMYAHYWGAYGIPVYVSDGKKLYYICNDLGYRQIYNDGTALNMVCHTAYDIKNSSLWRHYNIETKEPSLYDPHKSNDTRFFDEEPAVIGPGDKYKHYLTPVRNEEVFQYEDHKQHLEYTEMAAVRFPFKLLPFYHFDPRRFFSPELNPALHEFYSMGDYFLRHNNCLIQADTNEIKQKINEGFPFRYRYTIDDLKKKLLDGESDDTGLFWGVKMYAALGFPPYMYNSGERKKIFPFLDQEGEKNDTYHGLLDFYKYCARNAIPITCHGSPQGMTIADPGVYLKEYLKKQIKSKYYKKKKVNFPVGRVQFIQGLGLIDDFSSPLSWKMVLDDLGGDKDKFRLCLAHYGGMGFLSGEFIDDSDPKKDDSDPKKPEKSPYCWHKKIGELIEGNKQVYTDLSCYSIKKIPDFMPSLTVPEYDAYEKDFPVIKKVYQRVSQVNRYDRSILYYYVFKSNFQLSGDEERAQVFAMRLDMIEKNKDDSLYKEVYLMAKKLAEDINEYPRLRYRIMFGTDWPMHEIDVTGVPNYTSAMFVLLQLVSRELRNHWDAWHQFTVINPLRFLGLIEEFENPKDEKEKESLDFKFDKLTKYKQRLENYYEKEILNHDNADAYLIKYGFDTKKVKGKKSIADAYEALKRKYEGKTIPTAYSKLLFNEGRLKLTNGRKR
jgi:hypothetical protein